MPEVMQDFCTPGQAEFLHNARAGSYAGSGGMKPVEYKTFVAGNLRQIVAVIGDSQAVIARRIGVSPSKLGNWLRGDNYPDPYAMWLLCEAYGVTMDWLYRGRIYGLPAELADGLRAAASA